MGVIDLRSSQTYEAVSDDRLKDEDNAIWVMDLPSDVRQTWIKRIYWLRWVDRLAEQEQVVYQGDRFKTFQQAWQRLRELGQVAPQDHHWEILSYLAQLWFQSSPNPVTEAAIQAWDSYVEAMAVYHHRDLKIDTLADYEQMLERIAGSFFQCFPYQQPNHLQAARFFGLVDQFYNNLRDLREDSLQGLCYFPEEVLDRFNLRRRDLLAMSCFNDPNYFSLMEFWIEDYLPQIRRKTIRLALANDLHPSWKQMRDWCIHRYGRVERVLKQCGYNFALFPEQYWQEVRRDLAHYHSLTRIGKAAEVHRAYRIYGMARFLKLSPVTLNVLETGLKALEQGHNHRPPGKGLS
ncbi:MAG: squalene/phytoene synthase family protein [Cyanobacteria bacterium P01_H01_bin.119]